MIFTAACDQSQLFYSYCPSVADEFALFELKQ